MSPAANAVDEMVKGPGVKIAFDKEGNPTQAAVAFAKRFKTDVKELVVVEDGESELRLTPNIAKKAGRQWTYWPAYYLKSSVNCRSKKPCVGMPAKWPFRARSSGWWRCLA